MRGSKITKNIDAFVKSINIWILVRTYYLRQRHLLHEKVHFFKILVSKLVRWKIQRNHKISKFSKTQREPKLVEIAKLS